MYWPVHCPATLGIVGVGGWEGAVGEEPHAAKSMAPIVALKRFRRVWAICNSFRDRPGQTVCMITNSALDWWFPSGLLSRLRNMLHFPHKCQRLNSGDSAMPFVFMTPEQARDHRTLYTAPYDVQEGVLQIIRSVVSSRAPHRQSETCRAVSSKSRSAPARLIARTDQPTTAVPQSVPRVPSVLVGG